MLKIYADFNSSTADGSCWILMWNGIRADDKILKIGDAVILYEDDMDCEVEAVVGIRFIDQLGRDGLVATPDWSTKKKK